MTTSTNQLVILPKKVKWQRASRPKVRTGCLTWYVPRCKWLIDESETNIHVASTYFCFNWAVNCF